MRLARPSVLGIGLLLSVAYDARGQSVSEPPLALPPVMAPAPPETPAADSPSRRDPTAAVSVVKVRDGQAKAQETSEVLAQVPGVVVHDAGGLGQPKALSIRGAGANAVSVMLDGIPLNGPGGIADVSRIPAALLDRVEVLRGGASVYGSGGMGGAVNLVTPAARSGAHLFSQATLGSFGSQLGQAGATGSLLGGQGLVLANATHATGDFPYTYQPYLALGGPTQQRIRTNNEATIGEALMKVRHAAGPWTLSGLLEAEADSRGVAGTVDNPTPTDHSWNQRLAGGVRAERELGNGVALSGRGFFRAEASQFQGLTFGGRFWEVEQLAGAEAQASWLTGFQGLTADAMVMGDELRNTTQVNPRWAILGALLQDQLLLGDGRVSVVPSVRVDRVGPFNGISPKLGLDAQLPKGLELKANAGQSFRAPSFLELYVVQGNLLPNPTLQPERTLYADLGLTHQGRWTQVSLTGFYQLSGNLIEYEYYPPFNARPVNFATAGVGGAELEGTLLLAKWLSARASYTYQVAQDLLDIPRYYGSVLPNHPAHTAALAATTSGSWGAGTLSALYESSQYLNRGNRLELPARLFVNLGVCSPTVHGFSVTVEVKNLLDQRVEDYDGYPLPGRAYYATLRYAWDRPNPTSASMKGTT